MEDNSQRNSKKNPLYADFWLRFIAAIIDIMLVLVITNILSLIVPSLTLIFFVAVSAGYFVSMEASIHQGTLGKIAMNLKVTDLEEKQLNVNQAIFRYVARLTSIVSLGVGYLMAAFTDKKQALHDIIANTLVIQKPILDTEIQKIEPEKILETTGEPKIIS